MPCPRSARIWWHCPTGRHPAREFAKLAVRPRNECMELLRRRWVKKHRWELWSLQPSRVGMECQPELTLNLAAPSRSSHEDRRRVRDGGVLRVP